jgi:hypothetical protein
MTVFFAPRYAIPNVALLWFHPLFQTFLVVGDPTQQAKYLQHAGFLVRAAAKVRINRFGNCILVFSKNRLQLGQVLQPGFQAGVGVSWRDASRCLANTWSIRPGFSLLKVLLVI